MKPVELDQPTRGRKQRANREGVNLQTIGGATFPQPTVCFLPFLDGNPYQSMLAEHLATEGVSVERGWTLPSVLKARLRRRTAPDILHLHWPPRISFGFGGLKVLMGYMLRLWALRILGQRFVWTAHNLYHHEASWHSGERWMNKRMSALADKIIVHSTSAKSAITKEYEISVTGKIEIIRHAAYLNCYPNTTTMAAARSKLGLQSDDIVFLFFGQIRRYKRVPELLESFNQIECKKARLVVAGKAKSQEEITRLESLVTNDNRVKLYTDFVPNDQVQFLFGAADAVVFPYSDSLTSGAVILAMSMGKPCIAPDTGCFAETVTNSGGFLYDCNEADSLRRAMQAVIERREELQSMGEVNLKRAANWTWEDAAHQTAKTYRSALGIDGVTA